MDKNSLVSLAWMLFIWQYHLHKIKLKTKKKRNIKKLINVEEKKEYEELKKSTQMLE